MFSWPELYELSPLLMWVFKFIYEIFHFEYSVMWRDFFCGLYGRQYSNRILTFIKTKDRLASCLFFVSLFYDRTAEILILHDEEISKCLCYQG